MTLPTYDRRVFTKVSQLSSLIIFAYSSLVIAFDPLPVCISDLETRPSLIIFVCSRGRSFVKALMSIHEGKDNLLYQLKPLQLCLLPLLT